MSLIVELYERHLIRIVLSLLILGAFLLHVGKWVRVDALDALEQFAYDQRLRLTISDTVDDRIVIVDIDERSLAAEGRWPWARDKLALLMDQLFDNYGVAMVGFDVVFPERDESSGLKILEELAQGDFSADPAFRSKVAELEPALNYDAIFARSLEDRSIVLGYFFNRGVEEDTHSRAGVLPEPLFRPGSFKGRNVRFEMANGFGANLPELQAAATGAGHFNPAVDSDGKVRSVPMLFEFDGAYYESLSLAMARRFMKVDRVEPGYVEGTRAGSSYSGLEWLQVGPRHIPVDASVRSLVPFRGRKGSFPYLSATDVLHGEADAADLRNRIVLIGTSAPGLLDLRATPIQEVYPGVEVHANMIAGILDGNIKKNPAYTLGAEFVLVAASGLFMALLLPLLSPLWGTVATVVLLFGVVTTNVFIWHNQNLVLPLATGVVLLFVMYLFSVTYALFVETRGKRQLAGLFGQYVPPELVDEMSENPQAFSFEGESRELTVLFSDVRNFTNISEGLEPQELSQLMNEYLTPMTRIIHEHRGTIDKYMGDAIMAFWGAPLHDGDHAQHAMEASMEMLKQLNVLQEEFQAKGWPPIRIGIGLNTGPMNVGNMGSEFRAAYTVLGDAVNLGARLEGLTKGYGVELIVNESTMKAVPEYVYRELDRVRVKGKDKPVTIYEPVGLRKQVDKSVRDEIKLYDQALKLYRAKNWDMAELQFLNLQKSSPERALYQLYSERIVHYRQDPPPDPWDGVFTYLTK